MKNIPKILHLYWDGNKMSKLQTFTVETFHKLNPDWSINIYIPKQEYEGNDKYIPDYDGIDFFPLIMQMNYVNIEVIDLNVYNIDNRLHSILRSDIFRYKILYELGGVWSDFDVIWLKPMSHMNNVNCVGKTTIQKMGATVCFYNTTTGHHSIGILITSQKHNFYKTIVNKVITMWNKNAPMYKHDYQMFGVGVWSELYHNLQHVNKSYPDVVGIPYETFYPYDIFDLDRLYKRVDLSVINNNVMCVHWFNGHTFSKQYVNNGGFNRDCSMTTILKNENLI